MPANGKKITHPSLQSQEVNVTQTRRSNTLRAVPKPSKSNKDSDDLVIEPYIFFFSFSAQDGWTGHRVSVSVLPIFRLEPFIYFTKVHSVGILSVNLKNNKHKS